MKSNIFQKLNIVVFILLLFFGAFFISCSKNQTDDEHKNHQNGKKEIYYCTMHPNVVSDRPGVCPICNMELVKKSKSEEMNEDLMNQMMLSNSKVALANIETMKVELSILEKEIKAFAYLDFAEPNLRKITARFNGRIERLFVNKAGDNIRKGQPLFEVYSPDLIQAQNEYLIAFNNSSQAINSYSTMGNLLLNSAKNKLLLLGFTTEQVQQIETNKSINLKITYHSPFDGTVLEKKIQEGDYVREGEVLYEIGDFSTLWAIGEFYESDFWNIRVGDKIKLKVSSKPDETFSGVVNYIYPIVDKIKRTVKVRAIVNNFSGKLKPNMYGEISIQKSLGQGIKIPSSAVLIKGDKNVVWVKTGQNIFEPRIVELGEKFGDYYQIKSGLNVNEEIAVTGAFLLDSESQLKLLSQSHQQHGMKESQLFDKENLDHEIPKHENLNKNDGKPVRVKDKNLKPFNSVCPVQGEEIDPEVPKVLYKGKYYGFCCKGCDDKFMKDPEKYVSNLSIDGKRFIGDAIE